MITIIWNPSGFHLIELPSKGFKFNASYYITQILDLLSFRRGTQIGRMNRKLSMHSDNSRPHRAKVTLDFMERKAMKRAQNPQYSPDLAPSDFHFFDHVKQVLRGYGFADREALLHARIFWAAFKK
jgi:histone-lysine N-methyltransferase SETMAR